MGAERCGAAAALKKAAGAYNLACISGVRNDKEGCRKWLEVGEGAGALVTREHAEEDSDLESVRGEAWYKDIEGEGAK